MKALGCVKVRGRMYDPQCQGLTVLRERREKVDTISPSGCVSGRERFPHGGMLDCTKRKMYPLMNK